MIVRIVVIVLIGNGCKFKLGLPFADRLTFVLTDTLQIKKLKFLDLVQEELIDRLGEDEDMVSTFIATSAIQVEEIRKLIAALDEELACPQPYALPLEEPTTEEPEEELA